ncbi:MAG: ATP synthase F1 subunit epsilon [Ruminiclostridium sp.]|nr:ATP synthase F1 subunit epsilon [Ruminiclostridium sp.]
MTPFRLRILTPEGVVFDGEAEMITVRTTVGDKGILARHEPYVAALGIGQAKVRIEGETRIAAVSSGSIEVSKDVTTLLAQSFEWADEIDLQRAEKAQQTAEENIERYKNDRRKLDIAEYKLKRAINRIHVASLKK